MRLVRLSFLALALAGCYRAPQPLAPRTATPVATSFDRTWNALIDVFAGRNIPIKTIDRASGLLVGERSIVRLGESPKLADCGSDAMGVSRFAQLADYNVLVRGDSTQATVKATVRYRTHDLRECVSKGTWEEAFEQEVKRIAEGR